MTKRDHKPTVTANQARMARARDQFALDGLPQIPSRVHKFIQLVGDTEFSVRLPDDLEAEADERMREFYRKAREAREAALVEAGGSIDMEDD